MANRSRMMFPDSGLVVGPSHSDGGVYASVANGPDVELEGGEFIINKEATEDFFPLIKQINDIGRMEQMNNADNAQNAHSAIDALIASASTKMMPGGGMVAPKTPMYQEGGQTKSFAAPTMTFISSWRKFLHSVITCFITKPYTTNIVPLFLVQDCRNYVLHGKTCEPLGLTCEFSYSGHQSLLS